MKKPSILLLAMCPIVIFQQAFANHHESGKSSECENMANGSFSISGLDANQDGSITKDEYLIGNKSNTEKIFKHIDANSDGQLDQAEQKDIEAVYKGIHEKHKAKNTNIQLMFWITFKLITDFKVIALANIKGSAQ